METKNIYEVCLNEPVENYEIDTAFNLDENDRKEITVTFTRKKHKCSRKYIDKDIECFEDMYENLFLKIDDHCINYIVNYCPFCGRKSKNRPFGSGGTK